ncbi:MAG: putative nudix hydrolase YeaB [Bacteroidetes bacterium]|nr:putative nudix hydrolase YeaB [Bacteroidota bacterium]
MPLPGESAQYLMAPVTRAKYEAKALDETKFKLSAVMIVLCRDDQGNLFIPLTERFAYDGVHSGQVSLPGGKYDPADLDLVTTALRECEEEVGITKVEVIGKLSRLYIPVSNFMVQPVVGFCPLENVQMIKHVREVKHIVKLKLDDLLDERIVKEGSIPLQSGAKLKAPYFEVEGLKVWGATAMMLSEFKAVLKTIL